MTSQRWVAAVSDEVTALLSQAVGFQELVDRFHAKIDYGFGIGDCWVWTGALSDQGYGDLWIPTPHGPKRGKTVRAHRFSYVLTHSVIPCETPYLDHVKCLGRFCVNPSHLEPVTQQENMLRSQSQNNVSTSQQRVTRDQILTSRHEQRELGAF